ncbi:MAG: response regulator [Gammaproteobacteria bacterium]|nr:response regulator [Gammaproteobacteria bacterium]
MGRSGSSLDVGIVLREALAAACGLTGAQRGVIVAVDEDGAPTDDVYCSGFTETECRARAAWPDAGRSFAHLRSLPGPLRVDDYASYLRSVGIEPLPGLPHTFMALGIRHGDVDAGHFLLGDKADGARFTAEDEETLVLFAAQTAAAIGNARAHCAERRARAHLEAMIETSPVGVVLFDAANGRPHSLNREARRIAEFLRVPDQSIEDLVEVILCRTADGRQVPPAELLAAALVDGRNSVRAEEMTLCVPDGRSMRVLVNATSIPGDAGTVVVTFQDLAPLDEADRMRAEFLAMISHELRQPLASIKGSADILLEENLDPAETREFHRIIAEQSGQMRRLIGDLLDAGLIEAGTLSVAPESADVAALVEGARTAFATGGGRHTVMIDLPAGLPPVMVDRRRVVQVLGNLLANAARHAPAATQIRVAAAREGKFVALSVADEGRGIAPERLPHVFARNVAAGQAGGHGLGLAICKGLVEAQGGRIRAESAGTGHGATFTFTMPAALDHPRPATGPASATREPGEGARVLIVDDDPLTLRFARDALSAAGYAPLVTGVPQNLPSLLRAEKPRLVLLDLRLPGSDGIELMALVPELAAVPVIFISGYGRDETVARALDAGAVDYLVKPFSPTELVARVRAVLRRHEEPEPFTLGDLVVDYARRRVTLAGDAVDLTATEYELLRALSVGAGGVVTHAALLSRVWNDRMNADANLVRVFVRNLRRKLGDDAASPTYIFNVRGVGYRMPEAAATGAG